MKSPAKRLDGMPTLGQPSDGQQKEGKSLPSQMKIPLLHSPAKRPPVAGEGID